MNLSKTQKQIIAISTVAALAVVFYIGSYLPFRTSELWIKTQRTNTRSFLEYNAILDEALDFYSPIGQEEVVLNYLYFLGGIIPQIKDEGVIRTLVQKAEYNINPIIERGPGLNFVQVLYQMGIVYKIAGVTLHDPLYIKKAIETLELGRAQSPKRPIFIQELFNLYREVGDKDKLQEMTDIVIGLWPDQEEEVRQIIQEMLGNH